MRVLENCSPVCRETLAGENKREKSFSTAQGEGRLTDEKKAKNTRHSYYLGITLKSKEKLQRLRDAGQCLREKGSSRVKKDGDTKRFNARPRNGRGKRSTAYCT